MRQGSKMIYKEGMVKRKARKIKLELWFKQSRHLTCSKQTNALNLYYIYRNSYNLYIYTAYITLHVLNIQDIYIDTHMYTYIYICHIYIHTYIHACIHTYMSYIYIYTCMHAYIHTCICHIAIHIHACIHIDAIATCRHCMRYILAYHQNHFFLVSTFQYLY